MYGYNGLGDRTTVLNTSAILKLERLVYNKVASNYSQHIPMYLLGGQWTKLVIYPQSLVMPMHMQLGNIHCMENKPGINELLLGYTTTYV